MISRVSAIHLILIPSGFAGLGYQIVWTRMLSIGLGHEVYAVLAVVAAFFTGLALGALLFDRAVARSARPDRLYALLEFVIGLWSLALIWLIPASNGWISDLIGLDPSPVRQWGIAFAAPALLLAPATIAMGATLPAAEAHFARRAADSRGIGGLYGANALGAMIGAMATAFFLAPAIGFSQTLALFAVVNFACALAMLSTGGRQAPQPVAAGGRPSNALLLALFATGMLGIGYEVAIVRALAQILENTIYSFAAALAVYLLGTAIGAAGYQRIYAARRQPGWDRAALGVLLPLTATAAALGTALVFAVPPLYLQLRASLGGIGAEIAAAALTLGPASIAMGALFSHLIQVAKGAAGGLGAGFAANTIGGAFAPLLIGVIAVPAIGVVGVLVAFSALYALAALALLARAPSWRQLAWAGAAPALIAGLMTAPLDWRLVTPPEGGRIRAHIEGVAASASVVEDSARHRHLRLNGTFTMGGTASYALDRIQGHAALLQHPNPRRALFLGVGTGATLAATVRHPGLRVEAVDLSPEVLSLIPEFPEVANDLGAGALRISLHAADARRYAHAAKAGYDLILADNYHPAKDGAALLYTVEHYRVIREKLSEDGLAVQWLPLHQLDLDSLRSIIRTFQSVFPDARMHMGNYNLVTPILALYGSRGQERPKLRQLYARSFPADLRQELSRVKLQSPFDLLGGFLAGPAELSRFAGPGPLNTDDHPILLFEAPDTVYAQLAPASERLMHLVSALARHPNEALDVEGFEGGAEFASRLARYWAARDSFLALGARTSVTGVVNHDIRNLAPELIEIVRLSPDFHHAYGPIMTMARAVAATEPAYAMNLLEGLDGAHPRRDDARKLRAQIAKVSGL